MSERAALTTGIVGLLLGFAVLAGIFSLLGERNDTDDAANMPGEREVILRSYFDAYNRRDVEAVLSHMADDVSWMSISDDRIGVEATGKNGLAAVLEEYFRDSMDGRSILRNIMAQGEFLSAVEEAKWVSDGLEKSTCAVSVYRFSGQQIRQVWYFDAQPCD